MRVNGKEIPLNAPISLQAFLLEQHYDLRTIAVERNEEIVPKATYAEVMLQDCDVLEVVHVGKGAGCRLAVQRSAALRDGDRAVSVDALHDGDMAIHGTRAFLARAEHHDVALVARRVVHPVAVRTSGVRPVLTIAEI